MRSICFFSSYFKSDKIPYYIIFYLEELKNYFTEIVLLTNEKSLTDGDIKYMTENNFQVRFYKNEGFDFGMWYKALMEFQVKDYDRVGLVNDSCILFKKLDGVFDMINKSNLDYCGMTDSNAVNYHIQSYFLIINKNAVNHVMEYFKNNGIKNNINEVIKDYEIGLSSYLINLKLKIGAFYSMSNYHGEYNPMLKFADDLIKNGIPLIKKKIIYFSFRKNEQLNLMRMKYNPDPYYYIELIREINRKEELINFDLVTSGYYDDLFFQRIRNFKLKSSVFQVLRRIKFKRSI